MSCLHPIQAFLDEGKTPRRVLFRPKPEWLVVWPQNIRTIQLPCGKCYACLKSRAFDITVRAVAESRMHDFASFVTLTVDDQNLSSVFPHGLCHRPWQLFAKRLRKEIGSFRYLMCGEYGSRTLRPHYHAILFGPRFVDMEYLDDGGYNPSALLRRLWPYGNHSCSEANSTRIAYVAGYTVKDAPYGRDKRFWESRGLGLPYVKWSRRPSLGLTWLQRFWPDLCSGQSMTFVLNGKEVNVGCRYFFDKLSLLSPDVFSTISLERQNYLKQIVDNVSFERHDDLSRRVAVQQHQQKRKVHEL